MTESKAYPTMINGMPTTAVRLELLTFVGSIKPFQFSLKMFILSDSFNSKVKLLVSVLCGIRLQMFLKYGGVNDFIILEQC